MADRPVSTMVPAKSARRRSATVRGEVAGVRSATASGAASDCTGMARRASSGSQDQDGA